MLQSSSFNSHLKDEDERNSFYTAFDENTLLRGTIYKTIEEKLKSSIKSSEAEDIYDSPNWDRVIADNLGYRRALREVLTLLNG
jgi:hypothetical protein